VPLVVVLVLCIVVAGSPELRRRGRPPRHALRHRRRSGVCPVEFACLCASIWCNPRGGRGTPAPNPLCAGEPPPCAAAAAPLPAGRRLLGSCARPGPPDHNPTDRVSFDASPRRSSPRRRARLQHEPPDLDRTDQIRPPRVKPAKRRSALP
jgi:hypothetical protein